VTPVLKAVPKGDPAPHQGNSRAEVEFSLGGSVASDKKGAKTNNGEPRSRICLFSLFSRAISLAPLMVVPSDECRTRTK